MLPLGMFPLGCGMLPLGCGVLPLSMLPLGCGMLLLGCGMLPLGNGMLPLGMLPVGSGMPPLGAGMLPLGCGMLPLEYGMLPWISQDWAASSPGLRLGTSSGSPLAKAPFAIGGKGGCCMAKGGLPKAVMCPISSSGQDVSMVLVQTRSYSAPKRSNFSARSSAVFFRALSLT